MLKNTFIKATQGQKHELLNSRSPSPSAEKIRQMLSEESKGYDSGGSSNNISSTPSVYQSDSELCVSKAPPLAEKKQALSDDEGLRLPLKEKEGEESIPGEDDEDECPRSLKITRFGTVAREVRTMSETIGEQGVSKKIFDHSPHLKSLGCVPLHPRRSAEVKKVCMTVTDTTEFLSQDAQVNPVKCNSFSIKMESSGLRKTSADETKVTGSDDKSPLHDMNPPIKASRKR